MNKENDTSRTPGETQPVPVDLVLIVDTSDSMKDEATALSSVLEAMIQAVEQRCLSDLRVCWFGIEGTWPDTNIAQAYRDYLHTLGVADEYIVGRPWGTLAHQGAQEEGAAAIVDIARYFDWRPEAIRLIFFLGDEALKGGNPQTRADVVAANRAIAVAGANSVRVFTYCGTRVTSIGEAEQAPIRAEYARVATQTGGQAFHAPMANLLHFEAALSEIVCGETGQNDVELPTGQPCFELRWGNGPRDQIETDDRERLCIVARNPYTNVRFKELTIVKSVLSVDDGQVATMPDGTDSVYIKPSSSICFGDLSPCKPEKPAASSTVFREVTLVSRGAIPGVYTFAIEYAYLEELIFEGTEQFTLDLVKS